LSCNIFRLTSFDAANHRTAAIVSAPWQIGGFPG
jgi:hypothetical protein